MINLLKMNASPLKVLLSTRNAEGKFIVAVPSKWCNESGSDICSLDFWLMAHATTQSSRLAWRTRWLLSTVQ